ncbi:class I SAM-dependent methyltransferase [Caenispirillum salinarum]|uniref:class I SAM-dependent methyltransferase n=1 Tax=Caenispirillum salinarum TaxID=859058 RepID=UPI00384EE1FD
MWMDVVDLRDFYDGSLGQVSRRLLQRRLRAIWPDTRGMRVLGVGFATPFLGPFLDGSERVLAAMPGAQGVMRWPAEGPNRVMLADEAELPLPDRSIDRLVIAHGLEHTEHMRAMMRECWRVLTDGGRMIIVAPNRRGIWARMERTPFGTGRPYSESQITRLLRDTMFTPLEVGAALYMPPVRWRGALAWARPIEDLLGRWRWPDAFAGVLVVEAAKQIYAAPHHKVAERRRAYAVVPNPFRNGHRGGARPAGVRRDRVADDDGA